MWRRWKRTGMGGQGSRVRVPAFRFYIFLLLTIYNIYRCFMKRKSKAFSILELIVVIAILAILTYIFIGPGMRWYHEYKLYSEGQKLHYMVTQAKIYSISKTVYTSVCVSSSSISIYKLPSYYTSLCSGTTIASYTLPSYESQYLSYTENQIVSFNPRGVTHQNGNVCVYDNYINQYYMICVSYAGIRDTFGTGSCPTNC